MKSRTPWEYDERSNEYACSGGRKLAFLKEKTTKSDLGHSSTTRMHRCTGCEGCPHAPKCLKAGSSVRSIYVNERLNAHRQRVSSLLTSEEGVDLCRRRATDVETVFGDIKRNWNFKRFTLRGMAKVAHEWRLLMMGRNMRKLTRAMRLQAIPSS